MQANLRKEGNEYPLITIGIPVYNAEDYVRESIESVLAQTYEDIEVLILDDCGNDDSIGIVKNLQAEHDRGSCINIISQQQNMGPGVARNRLIEEARGRYIYFMDGDDTIAPNTISLLYKKLNEHNAEICFGSYLRIMDFETPHRTEVHQYERKTFVSNEAFGNFAFGTYGAIQTSVWNFLVKTDFFRTHSLWFYSISFWEDMTMMMRLPVYAERVVLLPDITYYYHCHYDSLSNFKQRDAIAKGEIEMTINGIEGVKQQTCEMRNKSYYPLLLNKLLMTDFYIACNIIQNSDIITPSFTPHELRQLMCSPVSLSYVMKRKPKRMANMLLSLIDRLPSCLSVTAITLLGRAKGLIK